MSEYLFGAGRGRVAEAVADQAEAIAQAHGCGLVRISDPGSGPRYWFAGPNRGEPFTTSMARAVFADLRAAGLLDADGHVRTIRRR